MGDGQGTSWVEDDDGGNSGGADEEEEYTQETLYDKPPSETSGETEPDDASSSGGVAAGAVGVVGGGAGGDTEAPSTPPVTEPPVVDPEPDEGQPEAPDQEHEPDPEPEDRHEPDADDHSDDNQDDNEDDDDDDENEQDVKIVFQSDAWDNVGWGLYPIRYQLMEEYGAQIEFDEQVVPTRNFGSPSELKQKWESDSRRHRMPVNSSIWPSNPPESTDLSNRAFNAARRQGSEAAQRFIRRLRIAAVVEGRNIEDKEVLLELAEEVGLDVERLQADWDRVHVREKSGSVDTPKTVIHINGNSATQQGYLHVDDVKMLLEQVDLEETQPRPIPEFVREYGPVTAREVEQVYSITPEEAENELLESDYVVPIEIGDATFWTVNI